MTVPDAEAEEALRRSLGNLNHEPPLPDLPFRRPSALLLPVRPALRDLLVLTAVCGLVYFTGLTTRGLTNWQEAQRALVAREMQQRHDWIVPTINGVPYLNKPPLFYWLQLAIAELRGAKTSEFDLRLAVALCGWAGVLATYVVARRLLSPGPPEDTDYPRSAALWSALFLATGILYVRSSRIGELDAALVPFTVLAIGAVHAAWRSHLDRRPTHWPAVLLGALAATGATLAKGPPALLVIALGAYGGIAIHPLVGPWLAGSDAPRRRTHPALIGVAGAFGALAFAAAGIWSPWSAAKPLDRIVGPILLAAMGALLGSIPGALATRERQRAIWPALARTHPLVVLGIPVLALWGWLAAARTRVGDGPVAGTIRGEADNLRVFVPESPLNNLGAAVYGVGVGSLAAMVACVWLVRVRPRLAPGFSIIVAWIVLNLIAFSVLGKGVARYLTPVWPAIAILGGAWFAWRPRGHARPLATRAVVTAAVAALAIGQAYWYGLRGAEQSHSPRELLAELFAPPHAVDPARLGTFEFDTPQMDYYAGTRVESFVDVVARPGLAGVGPRTIADLRDRLRHEGASFTVLARRSQPAFLGPEPAIDRLRAAGLEVEPIVLRASWRIDNDRTDVVALRVYLAP